MKYYCSKKDIFCKCCNQDGSCKCGDYCLIQGLYDMMKEDKEDEE